jgi:hypothetical protein
MSLLFLCGCTAIPTWQIHADVRIDCHPEDCLDEGPSWDQEFGVAWPAGNLPTSVCDWRPDAMIDFQAVFHHPDGRQDVGPELALWVNEEREISASSGTVGPAFGLYVFEADGSLQPAGSGAPVNINGSRVTARYLSGRGQILLETHEVTGIGARPLCP